MVRNPGLAASMLVQSIPGPGDLYSFATGAIGYDPLAGIHLSDTERAFAMGSAAVLGGGFHLLSRLAAEVPWTRIDDFERLGSVPGATRYGDEFGGVGRYGGETSAARQYPSEIGQIRYADNAHAPRPLGARGPASGRPFDPAAAGGPIRSLKYENLKITPRGVKVVERHLARFGPDKLNARMLSRLRAIAAGKRPEAVDLRFYGHELREFVRYKNLGWDSGAPLDENLRHELWNNAHTATLEDYGIREGAGVLDVE